MRDLEIRGAGNLLGGAQSGHIAAVGFDLYCELVTEAVGELKGEKPVEPFEVVLDLPIDAHLPREYVARDDVRMEAYRRLAAVVDPADVDDIRVEWQDRYGPIPEPAEALLSVARLRAECVRVRATSVSVQKGVARIDGLDLPESRKVRLKRLSPRGGQGRRRARDPDRRAAARGGRRARGSPASARRLTHPEPPGRSVANAHRPVRGLRLRVSTWSGSAQRCVRGFTAVQATIIGIPANARCDASGNTRWLGRSGTNSDRKRASSKPRTSSPAPTNAAK